MKEDKYYIGGRKVILDALKANKPIQKIYLQFGSEGPEIREIEQLARRKKIPVTRTDKLKFNKLSKLKNPQGILGLLRLSNMMDMNVFLDVHLPKLVEAGQSVLVYADRFNDPHNLGALIRTAEILRADAVCFPIKDSSPISPGVIKASMGAATQIPLIMVTTPFNFLEQLKQFGFHLIAAQKNSASIPVWDYHFPPFSCVIIGNEESGVKYSFTKLIDQFVHIPQHGRTESFNASVAGGILLYEIDRQKTTTS